MSCLSPCGSTGGEFEFESVFVLSLTKSSLTDAAALHRCINLMSLDLSRNALTTLRGLESLVSLKRLNVSHNQLERLVELTPLLALTYLRVEHNRLATWEAVQPLAALPHLRVLYLRAPASAGDVGPNAVCDLAGYPKRVVDEVCGGRLATLDGDVLRHRDLTMCVTDLTRLLDEQVCARSQFLMVAVFVIWVGPAFLFLLAMHGRRQQQAGSNTASW
jgi:hypothetical protein